MSPLTPHSLYHPCLGAGTRGEKFRLSPDVLRELRRKCHLSLVVKARSSICGVHTMVWLTFSKTFSSAAVLSDESAPAFPPLRLLPLLSPQSFITCSGSQLVLWPTLQTYDSFPVSGTWPGHPFPSPSTQDIWNKASIL